MSHKLGESHGHTHTHMQAHTHTHTGKHTHTKFNTFDTDNSHLFIYVYYMYLLFNLSLPFFCKSPTQSIKFFVNSFFSAKWWRILLKFGRIAKFLFWLATSEFCQIYTKQYHSETSRNVSLPTFGWINEKVEYSLNIQQDSPPAWPQEAYRPRPHLQSFQNVCPKCCPFFVQNFVHFLSQILSNIFVQIYWGGGTPGGTPSPVGRYPRAPPLWTDKLKTLPSRHTPYAGGNNYNNILFAIKKWRIFHVVNTYPSMLPKNPFEKVALSFERQIWQKPTVLCYMQLMNPSRTETRNVSARNDFHWMLVEHLDWSKK